MAYGDRTKPSSIEAWLEEHSPGYQYGWVLLLLGLTFVVMASGPPDAWVRILTVFLQGLTLLVLLLASRASRRLFRTAAIRRPRRAADRDRFGGSRAARRRTRPAPSSC